jgi:hypothetical protein
MTLFNIIMIIFICPEALPSVKEGPKTSAIIPLLTPTNFNNGKSEEQQ